MNGTDATTGKRLRDLEHLRQSVRNILTTPIGSRVMRREYGSRLFQLVDAPTNSETLLELYAATAEALRRWEPRLRVQEVRAEVGEPGRLSLVIRGRYLPDGREVTLEGVEVS